MRNTYKLIRIQTCMKLICCRSLCYLGHLQGDVGPLGAPGNPGKEGLVGPKVLYKTFLQKIGLNVQTDLLSLGI